MSRGRQEERKRDGREGRRQEGRKAGKEGKGEGGGGRGEVQSGLEVKKKGSGTQRSLSRS